MNSENGDMAAGGAWLQGGVLLFLLSSFFADAAKRDPTGGRGELNKAKNNQTTRGKSINMAVEQLS